MDRFSEKERAALRSVFESALSDYPSARVWLFGSRAKEDSRGGDIDLLLELQNPLEDAFSFKRKFLRLLRDALGEQKIDLVIERPGGPSSSFYALAKKEGEILWSHPKSN